MSDCRDHGGFIYSSIKIYCATMTFTFQQQQFICYTEKSQAGHNVSKKSEPVFTFHISYLDLIIMLVK